MLSGWWCAATAGFHPIHRCPRPGDGCCGTTPSKPGTRCSKRAGGAVHLPFADGIKKPVPPRDRHDAITQKLGLVLALSVGLLSYGLGVRGNHEHHGALAKGRSGVEKEESINLHPSRRRDRDRHHRYRLVCPLGTTAASGSFDQELTTHR